MPKPLSEMTADEIASLAHKPEALTALAHDHNDQVERREKDYQRVLDITRGQSDKDLQQERRSLEIKRGVDSDFRAQGLEVGAFGYGEHHERKLNAINDEQVRRYHADRERQGLPTGGETLLDMLDRKRRERGPDLPQIKSQTLDHEQDLER